MIRRTVLSTLLLALLSTWASAQASPLVPPEARVYRVIDRLSALGLIDSLLVGARALSQRDVVALLNEAERNLDRNLAAREWARSTIAEYTRLYNRPNQVIDAAIVESWLANSLTRPAPIDSNGRIDADINPLLAYRSGRPVADGATLGIETAHSATLGRYFAVQASPRATLLSPRGGSTTVDASFQRLAVNALFGSFAVEAGRDYIFFSQAPTGGLLLSENAPPLDMIRVWNERAWRVPLISRLLGPVQGSLFIADLGKTRVNFPHTKLIGYHVSTLPHSNLELGFEVLDAMGGTGGQPASFGDRVLDAVPVFDAFRTGSDFQFSNKLAGVDMHWRMPRWAGFEMYVEGDADDFDGRNLSRGFLADAAYLAGASLSCVVRCGRFAVRGEYHQTGIRYYTHTHYPLTTSGLLLGDPLGPRGVAGYLSLEGDGGTKGQFSVAAAVEARSGNIYTTQTTGPNDAGFHFVLFTRRPSEKRARVVATWSTDDTRPLSLSLSGGAEQVANFDFVGGRDRTNWLARVALVGRP